MNIKFLCRKSKERKSGESPVEMAVTLQGKRVFVVTPLTCKAENFEKECRKKEYKDVLSQMQAKATAIIYKDERLSKEDFLCQFEGKPSKASTYTLYDLYRDYLSEVRKEGSFKSYVDKQCVVKWMKKNFSDKALSDLDEEFVGDVGRKMAGAMMNASARKYLSTVKSIFKYAGKKGFSIDFEGVKIKAEKKDVECITEEEYKKVLSCKNLDVMTSQARDIFTVIASSGCAFCDVMSITKESIVRRGGKTYIKGKRKKTGVHFYAYLFPEGEEVLKKYDYDLTKIARPLPCINLSLKVLSAVSGIKIPLHTHIGRHYYCTRLLRLGMPMQVVMKATGHSSTAMLLHYEHLVNKDVIDTFEKYL